MGSTTHAPGVFINSKGIKTFVPLENNPEIFTHLVHVLGVSPELGFYDIYSIDDDDLLTLVPRPVHAIIFIAPANVYYRLHSDGKPKELTYAGTGEHEPVVWFKQTIGHSCGLMALIHSIGNGQAKQFIKPDSLIDKLLKEALPLKPLPRADVLYNSADLEKAHMSAAYKGDSKAPSSEDPNGYHFLSFVKGKDGHLWELDGSWDGPIDHGLLPKEDDLLSKNAIEMGIGKYVKLADGCIEYSMVALATNSEA